MKILVVSPLASHQPTGGAKRRIYNLLGHLQRNGHEIHFVYTCHEAGDHEGAARQMSADWDSVHVIPFTGTYVKSMGEDFGVDDWIEPGSGERVAQLCEEIEPDLVLVQYVFQSYYCDFIPDHIPTVIDTHDKLSRRHIFEQAGIDPGFFYTTEEEELRGLARADLVLAIQDNEAGYFERAGKPVVVVGHIAEACFDDRRFNSMSKIGIVAAYNKFNLRAIEDALPPVLERLDEINANCEIHLAGNIAHGVTLEHPKLIKRGFVESVAGFYAEMDLILNPTLDGTGLKIKTIEAMAYGLPLISTMVGFDGLVPRTPFHAAEDGDALADLIEDAFRYQFGTLTKLANFSRAIFTEYQHNLRYNIASIFSPRLKELAGDVDGLRQYVADTTFLIGTPDAPNYQRLRDITTPQRNYRLAHVVNPVDLGANSDLYIAQPVTFESMRRAKALASDVVDVDLLAVGYSEDDGAMPQRGFKVLPELERSVLDVQHFDIPRKLPLLGDLLAAGFEGSDADYLVFTNVDIALTPQFYVRVAELIDAGHDAIIINRRTISKQHSSVNELAAMYAEYGKDHPGYDCFVIKRELYEQFNLGNICVGVHMIGRVLLWNLKAFAKNLLIETKEHLTFHIGDDVPSKDARLLDYIRHNVSEALAILGDLEKRAGLLTRLQDEGARKLLTMNFGPTMFKEFQGNKIRPALARPIMIHALFRAGSTYLWRKMRRLKHVKAYYEPLHEDLALFRPKSMEMLQRRHKASTFHKLDVDEWLFKEFETILASDPEGRVTGYDRRFAYDEFTEPEDSDALAGYIDTLLNEQDVKTPILQFNRSSMRQNWFRRRYPDALHIYMHRSARGQWGSYAGFVNRGRMGFVRNTVMLAGKSMHKPSFAPLNKLVPLVRTDNTAQMHQIYDAVYDCYSFEELYTVFYYVWLMSSLMGAMNADIYLDTERLSVDRLYQLETEFELMCANIVIDLSDARIPTYDPDTLGLSPATMDAIETRVHGVLAQSGWKLPLDRLRACGLVSLADRLEQAAQTPVELADPVDLERRRTDMQKVVLDEIQSLETKTWAPRENPNPIDCRPRTLIPVGGGRSIEYNTLLATGGRGVRDLLLEGWHAPEPRRVLSSDSHAVIECELAACEGASLSIRLAASCETRQSAPVRLLLDDVELVETHLGPQSQHLECPVPQELLSVSGRHRLEIECPVEDTADGPVGVIMESLEFVAASKMKPKVKERQAPKPGLLLNDVFPVSGETRPALSYGWDAIEGRYVWSNSFIAAVQFSFHHKQPPSWIALDLATLNELSNDNDMFMVRLNGQLIYHGQLWPQMHRIAIKGVDKQLKAGELNEITLESRQLYMPENDHRQLGLRLRNIGVTKIIKPPKDAVLEPCPSIEGLEIVAWNLEGGRPAQTPAAPRAEATETPPASQQPAPQAEAPMAAPMLVPRAEPVQPEPAEAEHAAAIMPGQRLSAADDIIKLRSGWSYREGEHVWAVERRAFLAFDVNGSLEGVQRLRLGLVVPENHERLLLARLNGRDLGTIHCTGDFQEHELALTEQPILPNEENSLEIEAVDTADDVVDAGGRPLVFCFRSLSFEA